MARTVITDYTGASDIYRIPHPTGAAETAEIEAAIAEGERSFADTFGIAPASVSGDELLALKCYCYCVWLKQNWVKRTAQGAGAKVRFNQADNVFDAERYMTAYNRCCVLLGQPNKKLKNILNF